MSKNLPEHQMTTVLNEMDYFNVLLTVWWVVSWTWQLQLEVGVVLVGHERMVCNGNMTPPKTEENCQFFSIQAFKSESRTIHCARQCQHISDTDTDVLPYNHIHQCF
jgi:hypothetical protein